MGGFRFRIGPKFLKLNISKTGYSVTGGVPGARVNVDLSNRRKRMLQNTFWLPGTGLSYRSSAYGPQRHQVHNEAQPPTQPHSSVVVERPVRFVDGAYWMIGIAVLVLIIIDLSYLMSGSNTSANRAKDRPTSVLRAGTGRDDARPRHEHAAPDPLSRKPGGQKIVP